jgi:hypothetical protein
MVDSADGGQRGELARRIAEISGSIDRWRCPDPRSAVKRAEVGTLWVAEGLDLQPPEHRSLML